ncbi:MAG: imidazole glycerol phosphate synthase subunit HisH [Bacteroidetes bacterium]|nr:MAG: imidazole glycerol phosphate synthase subunit HisH [Bacteroidota bacterium]
MIVIVDYGLGNLRSVLNKFKKINVPAKISESLTDIEEASKLILPGVGHFAKGISKLKESGIDTALAKKVLTDKTPILGICLGMQLFLDHSEEGDVEGLKWIKGDVKKFNHKDSKFKVPHMGWNSVVKQKDNVLLNGHTNESLFYFVHSYYASCVDQSEILSTTFYEFEFTSSIQKDNIYGTQFHPEKSHEDGLELIRNFAKI